MKNSCRTIRCMAMIAFIITVSQTTLLAQDQGTPSASSGLSAGQTIGGFILLLLLILVPLTKRSNKASH